MGNMSIHPEHFSSSPLIKCLLGLNAVQFTMESLSVLEWWATYKKIAQDWELSFDRAIIGGLHADRLAFAFAGGYHNALRAMFPFLRHDQLVSFCVTEEGGGHPRAIKTEITPAPENSFSHFSISGNKKFITMAKEADTLLVAVSQGIDTSGQNRIRIVVLDVNCPGIEIQSMAELPFIPEISHGTLQLAQVAITQDQLLPGDGYLKYIKPFRTVEDIHVCAGLLGYVFRVSIQFKWPHDIIEELVALIHSLRAISLSNLTDPAMHIVLGGYMQQQRYLIEKTQPLWDETNEDVKLRWKRDISVMRVAETARSKRLETAWKQFNH